VTASATKGFMRTVTLISLQIVKVAAIIQIILGTLFWIGYAYTLVPVHVIIGCALVLALVTLSALAIVAHVNRGLAAFELVWGLALAGFGVQQVSILIGPLHWIIRVIHLLMAIAAVKLGEALAKAILASLPERVPSAEREPEIGPRRAS
jgi:hypothetical protein